MTQLTLPLAGLNRAQIPLVGSKAAALGELQAAGYRVPDGFVLSTAAYPEFVAPVRERIKARLTQDVIMDPAELESSAAEIRGWLEAEPFSSRLRGALEAALNWLPAAERSSLAARTSTASDDLASSFGAGVERAYLGLVGSREIERASARCWAALWSSRAIYYRFRKKIDQTSVALAVLVQLMVRADAAGVMFTQNPMTGSSSEVRITSLWGLGAPLTSARLRPDEFVVDKATGKIQSETIAEQVVQLVIGQDGHTEERSVPAERVEARSLTPEQVSELASLGRGIESLFGAPQDVEWALAGGELYILQARPIGIRNS